MFELDITHASSQRSHTPSPHFQRFSNVMDKITDLPDTSISNDPDEANYKNYLAWQQQIARRRRESSTHFNRFQYKAYQRSSNQAVYKEELQRESEQLKDIVERRLSRACSCGSCGTECKSNRSNSESSLESLETVRSTRTNLSSTSSKSPPGTTVRGPTSSSSRNSLIVSPPPRSRHHQRRRMSLPPT